jgi:sterol 24-C-methyltransferase
MVDQYYDLATDFYEYGWGDSFHFAHRYKTESLRESIVRHEHYLAAQLGLKVWLNLPVARVSRPGHSSF